MLEAWQEFEGGQIGERYLRMWVTLSIDGGFYFGRRAFEALGMPDAVKLYFEVGGNRIGVKAAPIGDTTFKIVHSKPVKGRYGHLRATTFCRHYGIIPKGGSSFRKSTSSPTG